MGATIAEHLQQDVEKQSAVVEELLDSLYVDAVISGGEEISSLQELKSQMIKIFRDGGFELHKWHSNAVELEDYKSSNEVQMYAAPVTGSTKHGGKYSWTQVEQEGRFDLCDTSAYKGNNRDYKTRNS